MKNKLLSLASILAVSSANAVEIGPTGSGVEMSGFIDIAFTDQADTAQETVIGQVEINFDYSTGPVSASVGLDFGGNNAPGLDADEEYDGDSNLEQAYVTYDFGNGFSITAGKMLTYMGFEAYDPTDMYQYSYAYDMGNTETQSIYDAYDVGVSIDYATDTYSIGVWASAENSAGYELALAYTGIENFTAKAIWSDFSDQAGGPAYTKNTYWVSYQLGSLLLAAEIAEADYKSVGTPSPAEDDQDKDGFLIMGNYAFTDSIALTLRYSVEETSDWNSDVLTSDIGKFTISPSYVFTDNLSGLVEFSTYDEDVVAGGEIEDLLAVELIYTF